MAREYSEQELQQMREQAIAGAFAMQKRSRFSMPERREKKQSAATPSKNAALPPRETAMPEEAEVSRETSGRRSIPRYYHTTHAVETLQVSTPQERRQTQQTARAQQQPRALPPMEHPKPQQQGRAAEKSGLGGILPGMDNEGMLLLFLMLLLQQEHSDQLLLFAMIYIMM